MRFLFDTDRNYGTLCTTAFVTNSSETTQFIEQNYDELSCPTEVIILNIRCIKNLSDLNDKN